ncbi:MAG: thioredoxin family protein [Rhodothermaceae bacterium]
MKKVLLILTAVFVLFSYNTLAQHDHKHGEHKHDHDHGHNHELKWHTNLEDAQAEAAKTGKPLFVAFEGSDWCGYCIKLHKEILSKGDFIEYAAHNLVLVNIDFPRRKKLPAKQQTYNNDLAKKYKIQGYPTVVLMDKKGKEINRTGYLPNSTPKDYVKHLKDLLAKK